jgi:hypothetical protein
MNLLSKSSSLEESIKKMEAVLVDVGCEAKFSKPVRWVNISNASKPITFLSIFISPIVNIIPMK